jgi:thiamine-monophosphate kinase
MGSEFSLIERHFAHLGAHRDDIVAGVGDDCARVTVPGHHELAISIDTLVAGVHFPDYTAPEDLGWKALACGLSDLAAEGAEPAWATLAITLPHGPDPDAWLDAFAHGFGALATEAGIALIGGDTTGGHLSVTVQVAGYVPAGQALQRSGARAGDHVCVSGWPGEAAAGLDQLRRELADVDRHLQSRLNRPTPRTALGIALRGRASACIDVSDSLAADLGHILDASGVGATIDLWALPISSALAGAGDAAQVRAWVLDGGDDYELCFCLPRGHLGELVAATGDELPLTVIGEIETEPGLRARAGAGAAAVTIEPHGYDHFCE